MAIAAAIAIAALGFLAACGADRSGDPGSAPLSALPFGGTSGGTARETQMMRGPLPAAFKGYELYAWDASTEFEYTLMTGTNRQKSIEEITARGQTQSEGEFVSVSGRGLAELQQLLERVPSNTTVLLAEVPDLPPLSEASRDAIVRLLDR